MRAVLYVAGTFDAGRDWKFCIDDGVLNFEGSGDECAIVSII